MTNRATNLWRGAVSVAIAISLMSSTASLLYHGRVLDRLDAIERLLEEHMMTTKWTSGGLERTFTSVLRDGETTTDLAGRHREELATMLGAFPRDP